MKYLINLVLFSLGIFVFLNLSQCKSQDINNKVPFKITEKTYFYWVGGKKGTNGVTIKIVGNFETTNLGFSSIFFQNREYDIIPNFSTDKFTLIGNYSKLVKKDINMHQNPANEYGNEAPNMEKNIPFDLENDEAVLVYVINGKEFFVKISDIKQLDTVNYP